MATYDFTLDAQNIVTKAYEKCRIDSPTSTQLTKGYDALNLLVRSIDGHGKFLWAYVTATLTLQSNIFRYTVSDGLASDINSIVDIYYRNGFGGDTPLRILSMSEYDNINNKFEIGKPSKILLTLDAVQSSRTLYVLPTPSSVNSQSEVIGSDTNNYKCIRSHKADTDNKPITGSNWPLYWELGGSSGGVWATATDYTAPELIIYRYQRPLYDFDLAADNPDFPANWVRHFIYRLASDLADSEGIAIEDRTLLEAKGRQSFDDVDRTRDEQSAAYHNKGLFF